jgi:hypothetical protein
MARAGRGEDPDGERSDFVRLVELARGLGLAARDGEGPSLGRR